VRPRILLAIVGSAVATLAAFGVPLAWAVDRAYRNELRLRLEGAALAAAPELTERGAGRTLAEPPLQRQGIAIAYYTGSGDFVAGIGPSTADPVVRAAVAGRTGLGSRAVAVPVSENDQVVGVVRAEEAPGLLEGRIHRTWLMMAGLALFILACIVGLGAWLARRLTAPVHDLADAAERLGDGDFAVAPEPSGIVELDSAGLALAAAASRLERVLARERALTADVTHQLRTPLTALRLELEAGAERAAGPDVSAALAEADRLEATISSILALARDGDRMRDPISIDPVLEATCTSWAKPADAAGRSLCSSIAPGLRAPVSAGALRQILDVLVDNALRHGRGDVEVRARRVGAGVEITVSDEGTSPPDRDLVFARRSASARGHGIGLALARSLAEAEGCRLELVDTGGETTFSLLLPGSGSDD
jgi:signal transduction histidine kinase